MQQQPMYRGTTPKITLYAKGYKSTASGILGVDESWTITAN